MCCPLNQTVGNFIIQTVRFEEKQGSEKEIYLSGIYDRTPKTLGDRFSRFFQHVELLEKIAEVFDECFHLLGSLFQRYTNLMVYQTLRNLHHAAHDVEHVLHSFCFLGDVSRLLTGKFLEYQDQERTKLDFLGTLSRISHATAHFFASAKFLHELKLCSLASWERVFKYNSVFNAAGYAIGSISLIWQRYQGQVNDQFMSDMCIQMGGFLFEVIHLSKTASFFVPYTTILNKVASLAGIIHAWFVVQRLMSKDKEAFSAHFVLPKENGHTETALHHHAHDHHHAHEH